MHSGQKAVSATFSSSTRSKHFQSRAAQVESCTPTLLCPKTGSYWTIVLWWMGLQSCRAHRNRQLAIKNCPWAQCSAASSRPTSASATRTASLWGEPKVSCLHPLISAKASLVKNFLLKVVSIPRILNSSQSALAKRNFIKRKRLDKQSKIGRGSWLGSGLAKIMRAHAAFRTRQPRCLPRQLRCRPP